MQKGKKQGKERIAAKSTTKDKKMHLKSFSKRDVFGILIWKKYSVVRKWRGAEYRIHVENPKGVEKGVACVTVNGTPVDAVPVMPAGSVNEVSVIMG